MYVSRFLQMTSKCLQKTNALKTLKQSGLWKSISMSTVLTDKWDNPASDYFKDTPAKKENIDRLIYEFKARNFLRISNVLFYGTACFGLYIAPDILLGSAEHTALNMESVLNIAGITISVVIIPILSRIFTKRIVLKLYHNSAKDTYIAHVFTPFLFERKLYFHQKDVEAGKKNMFINLTTLYAKKHPMFLQPYGFRLPSDFNHLMGYD